MDRVTITFASGSIVEVRQGITASELIPDSELNQLPGDIVAIRLNNHIVSLSYRIMTNAGISPVVLDSPEGTTLYRRTLCLLLAIASSNLFPDRRLVIGHSLGEGYFCCFEDEEEGASIEDVSRLAEEISRLVQADLPIVHDVISYSDAIEYFEKNHQPNTALLLKYQNRTRVPIYRCGDYIDLSHGPLLSHTGTLDVFEVRHHAPGFLLRYPASGSSRVVPPFVDKPVLFSIYEEYKTWGKILNMDCIGQLNALVNEGNIQDFIQVAEALHNKKIAYIADMIALKREATRVVLIAGPSSSGKTTFSKKLAIQLRVVGRNPINISLDDYFLPREKTPVGPDGNPDFESLGAIDVPLLNKNLLALLEGKEVTIPRFDFVMGGRKKTGRKMILPERSILILEGIHGLNENLTPQIDRNRKFKIYVSALTQLNLDDHNRISTTDNRLIRRMVRDYQFRGHSANMTLQMWPSVRHGEDSYIFPFQDTADVGFNSALDYELAVLKVYAESLLRTIKPDVKEYSEASRLLSFLSNVLALSSDLVPSQSILREFIGRSEFHY